MENKLLQASVTLAQTFVENLDKYDRNDIKVVGENIIRFLYKWLGSDEDKVEYALIDFNQHNTDCRYECYCCGQCEEVELDKNEPNVLDENIQNIVKLLQVNREVNIETDDDIFADYEEEW